MAAAATAAGDVAVSPETRVTAAQLYGMATMISTPADASHGAVPNHRGRSEQRLPSAHSSGKAN